MSSRWKARWFKTTRLGAAPRLLDDKLAVPAGDLLVHEASGGWLALCHTLARHAGAGTEPWRRLLGLATPRLYSRNDTARAEDDADNDTDQTHALVGVVRAARDGAERGGGVRAGLDDDHARLRGVAWLAGHRGVGRLSGGGVAWRAGLRGVRAEGGAGGLRLGVPCWGCELAVRCGVALASSLLTLGSLRGDLLLLHYIMCYGVL